MHDHDDSHGDWKALLAETACINLVPLLRDQSIDELTRAARDDRPALLTRLKNQVGITKLSERQALANVLAKRARSNLAVPPFTAESMTVPARRRPLTIAGKRDGFGAQLMAQMSGIAFCAAHGRQYVHTPMDRVAHLEEGLTAIDMDAFGNLGHRSGRVADLNEWERTLLETKPFCEQVAREPDLFTADVCDLLRRKYHAGPSQVVPLPKCFERPSGARCVVAVHIRRGDVTPSENVARFVSDDMYRPLLKALGARHPGAHLLVISEGEPAEFESITSGLATAVTVPDTRRPTSQVTASQSGVSASVDSRESPFASMELLLGGDPRVAFHALVNADVLLVAKSAFSYAAALLSRSTVYSDVVRRGVWGWHRCPSAWDRLIDATSAPPSASSVASLSLVQQSQATCLPVTPPPPSLHDSQSRQVVTVLTPTPILMSEISTVVSTQGPSEVPSGFVALSADESSRLAEGRPLRVKVGGREVAIFVHRDELCAIDADCPHQGVGLEHGDIEDLATQGPCVSCPRHGWRIELRSGFCEDIDDYVGAYEVRRLADGRLCVSTTTACRRAVS